MAAEVYILIITKYGTKKEVSEKLLNFENIENIHELYGQYDIIIKIKSESMEKLEEFIHNNIRNIPEIEATETLVISDVPKPD
ncbi:Lrp/AsnC family transcriptional regulator [Candidatus Woesearchaeota archaeon]|nr:Lrp/AsnC family transcriptional regulator [Candidatus Woesearchaeota archaeon]